MCAFNRVLFFTKASLLQAHCLDLIGNDMNAATIKSINSFKNKKTAV